MTSPRSLILVIALALLCFKVSAQIVVSDFATNADGWTAPNALGPTFLGYTNTGGNPNGFVYAQTPGSIPLGAGVLWIPYFLNAPAKFLGSKGAYYGGGIAFDATQTVTGTATQVAATAVMTDVSGISYYYYPVTFFKPPSFGSWQTFEIPLSASTGEWKTSNSATGTAATAAQIQSVLNNLNTLQIQGLYQNANVVTRFDNNTTNIDKRLLWSNGHIHSGRCKQPNT